MDDLERVDAPADAKRLFAALIRRHAEQNGSAAPLDREERIKFARKLLDQREGRQVICQRLQHAYCIGRSQAYEDIAKALQIVRQVTQRPDGEEV
jgi:hypothetical protein